MADVIGSVVGEMKTKPFTMLLMLALWGVVTLLWLSKTDYAMASDLTSLKNQVAEIGTEFKRGNLETQLRNINTELFNLQQKVSDIRSEGKRPDQIYYDKINELISDKERITRQLGSLK